MIHFFQSPSSTSTLYKPHHGLPTKLSTNIWLFGEAKLLSTNRIEGTFIGPRRMITPWSTNAVDITETWE